MPNTTPIFRQNAILAFVLRKPYASFAEIERAVNAKLEQQYLVDDKTKIGFSKRTFERDLKDLYYVYGAQITYSPHQRGYFVENSVGQNALAQMLQSFEVLNAFKLTKNIAPFVFLEERKPVGNHHLALLLNAIKNKKIVTFNHQKYWQEKVTNRCVLPMAVKEYKHRWYLLAQEEKGEKVKTFGLDRITNLKMSNKTFQLKAEEDLTQKFKHAFGVINEDGKEPENIVLSFTPQQGKFVTSLPLHHSQKVVLQNKNEVRISLKIYATIDFIMELLSFGAEVKVLEPQWLQADVKKRLQKALKQYDI